MFMVRRFAAVTVAATALVLGGGTVAATAAAAPAAPAAVTADAGYPGGNGEGHRPLQFGPFQFPANGMVSGNFGWNTW
jgi:hypothetical protein